MTTRITLAILLTTWVVLIVGETAAFWIAPQSRLVIFDDSITTRAIRVLEERFDKQPNEKPRAWGGDQFQIHGPDNQIVTQPLEGARAPQYTIVRKPRFETTEDGKRFRSVDVRTYVQNGGELTPVTITYSRPAEKFDWLLEHLSSMLLLISLACGLTTAWLALKLSRTALRPRRETADVIAKIDERQLGTRLNADDLPVELAPM